MIARELNFEVLLSTLSRNSHWQSRQKSDLSFILAMSKDGAAGFPDTAGSFSNERAQPAEITRRSRRQRSTQELGALKKSLPTKPHRHNSGVLNPEACRTGEGLG